MWSIAQVATAEFYEFMEFSDQGGHGQSAECRGDTIYRGRQGNLFQNEVKQAKNLIVDFSSPPPVAQRETRAGDDVSRYLQCLHGPPHSAVCAAVIMFVAATISHPSRSRLSPVWLYSGSIVAL